MEHAHIAIVGGGIAGCALLYNLTRQGCSNAVLFEKGELTSGSTWHAAGNIPLFAHGYQASRFHRRSLELYIALAEATGSAIGWHRCGSLRLATTRDQRLENARHAAKARALGIEVEVIGPNEVGALFPYLDTASVEGAAWTPADGHVDPSSLTNALAQAARAAGGIIHRQTRVLGASRSRRRRVGSWPSIS
jgi:dimethylglycine dehydrogenase